MPRKLLARPQSRVSDEALRVGLRAAKGYVQLTRAFYHGVKGRHDLETLMVRLAVFIGDAEGRPMSASKLAHFTGLSRPTVYRRLATLQRLGIVERTGRTYHYARDAMLAARTPYLQKAIANL